jgi:hypothetical protein
MRRTDGAQGHKEATLMREVTVSIADAALARFDAIVAACRRAGLQVTQQLPSLGIVVGRIDPGRIPDLQRIEGVATVELARDIELPPPDSGRQ